METQKPLIIHHRGRHGLIGGTWVPENTLSAFTRAADEGAAMIECDVWDGLLVAHNRPFDSIGVPTLPQVLDMIDGQCAVNIEIKHPDASTDVLRTIDDALTRGRWQAEQFVISSFHHSTVIRMKRTHPQLRVGIINDGVLIPRYLDWVVGEGDIDQIHLSLDTIRMDSAAGYALRTQARFYGIPIWVWTVNRQDAYNEAFDYGAAAIFTDMPHLFP